MTRTEYTTALRKAGLTPTEIARRLGVGPQFVSTATNRVMRADAAESGENIEGAYW